MEPKDFFIRDSKQIVNHLNDMVQNKCSLTVTIDDQLNFLTGLFEVNLKENLVKFDCSRNQALNQQLLNASKVLFRTEVYGIKASFKAKNIRLMPGDRAMFVMSIPDSIYWMQRRDYHRIRIPNNHHIYLQLLLKSSGKNYTMETFIKKYKLTDIGTDGFSFMNKDNDIQMHFESNIEKMLDQHINGTLIMEEENLQSEIVFTIKNVEKNKNGPAGYYRVGCQFTEIVPLFQANIQRYMQRIELDSKIKDEDLL